MRLGANGLKDRRDGTGPGLVDAPRGTEAQAIHDKLDTILLRVSQELANGFATVANLEGSVERIRQEQTANREAIQGIEAEFEELKGGRWKWEPEE